MPALVAGIRVFLCRDKAWMAGSNQVKPGHDEDSIECRTLFRRALGGF
jgi:hypothetical protein